MVVISPHLDDAVFSCGSMLAASPGSVVITLFAGTPDGAEQNTDWDRQCGFSSATQAVAHRRQEDEAALSVLEATPVWLPFLDSQYGGPQLTPAQLATPLLSALQDIVTRHPGDSVLFPMGLFHDDHLRAHDASVQALSRLSEAPALLVYEDLPYRDKRGLVQGRLGVLAGKGLVATPANLPQGEPSRKQHAVKAYGSQLGPLGPLIHHRLAQPERCWLLETAHD